MKIYCSSCDKVQPVQIDKCLDAKTNEPFQDIVCAECHLVIASGTDIAQPEHEPVAWLHWLHGPVRLFLNKDEAMLELERLNRDYPVDRENRKMRPLVLGDTTPPQRKPLTDEQRMEMWRTTKFRGNGGQVDWFIEGTRAAETAHGIKGDA